MSCHFVDLKLDDESDEVGLVKRKVKGGVDLDMGDLSNGTWGVSRKNIGRDKEMVGGLNKYALTSQSVLPVSKETLFF